MPVDTSMYQNAGPQPMNPVNLMYQMQAIKNMGAQNNLLNADTGVAQQRLTASQIQNAMTKQQILSRGLVGLMASKNGQISPSDVVSMATNTMAAYPGLINKDEVASLINSLPSSQDIQSNPGAVMQWAKQRAIQNQADIAAITPHYNAIGTGGTTQFVDTNPYTNPNPGAVPNTLSPGQLATQVPNGMGPNGQPIVTTLQSRLQQQGAGNLINPMQQAPQGNPTPSFSNPTVPFVNPLGGVGQMPGGAAPQSQQQAAAGSTPIGNGSVALANPGAGLAANAVAQGGSNQFQALQQAANAIPTNEAAINNMRDSAKNFSTGPMATAIYGGENVANQLGRMVGLSPFQKQLSAQEEFNKNASTLIGSQFQALGGTGTDQQLGQTIHSNPNQFMSQEGVQNMLAMLQGNNMALKAKSAAAQAFVAQNGAQNFNAFNTQWNQNFYPRAYQAQFMTPAARTQMFNSMSPGEKGQFVNALRYGEANGYFNPQSGGGSAPNAQQ